ncbi:MAG TPA: AraC family transcriptional regulator [Bacillota bacterium]|nr:AraC family transcriptional regulator [Bacillota bacterium]
MSTPNRSFANWNPYIIDITYTTAHTLYCLPGTPYRRRTVRFYEIEFIFGGAGEMTTAGKHFKTMRGDLFFRKPGIETQGISGYYSYVVAFDPIYQESRQNCYRSQIPYWIFDENTFIPDEGYFDHLPDRYNTARFSEIEPLFANIIQAFTNGKENNHLYLKANLLKIFSIIEAELGDNPRNIEKRAIRNNYDKIITCKEYIDNNLGDKFTLEMLARRCGLSRNFFCRIFKEILGNSPFEYIIENRMILARKLLTTTNISIEQISSICGFDDIAYFYRLFKRYYHATPALVREKFRAEAFVSDEGK